MKLLLAALFAFLFPIATASAQSHPIPPGVRQADQAEAQTERNIPPPSTPRATTDLARLNQEAIELASIAQTIPPDLASIQKGMLPKDIIQKLKQIEKLSKHLRSQLDHQPQ